MHKLADLLEARASAVAEMRRLTDAAEAEKRDLSDDEDRAFKAAKAKVADLDKKIERARDLAEAERTAPAILHNGRGDGNFEERARGFSITKAIRAAIGDPVDAGLETEISQEVRRRQPGRNFQGQITVPDECFLAERRTLLVGSSAADLMPNVHRPDLFIDRLRASLITGRLGATILDGLVGTVDIPKQTGSSTAQWVTEDQSLTETDAAFGDVNLTPKTVGAMTSFSRRTLINAVPSIEQLVRNDLAQVVAHAIDTAALFGDGDAGVPLGVRHQVGVTELTLAGPTWSEILAFPAAIQAANADLDALGWALAPHAVKKLRSTTRVADDGSAGFLMETPTALAGYPAAVSTQMPGSPGGSPAVPGTTIFGAWSQLLVAYWSGTDILVNPYEGVAYAKGRVLVRAMRDVDVAVRHAQSFAYADDLAV